jgi:DNA-binding response OmpR family regulator
MSVVLIVDDEKMVQHFMQRALENEGYKVFTTGSADEALSLAQTFNIDLVITDIRMPGMDGKKLGAALARLPHVPEVIYASASDTPPEGIDYLHYLQKPFTGDSLRQTVRAVLSK